MFSWYKYLIVSLVFSHLGFWSGNLFLIAPFPDLCLLVPFSRVDGCIKQISICPLCLVWVRAPRWQHVRQANFCLRVCPTSRLHVLIVYKSADRSFFMCMAQNRVCAWFASMTLGIRADKVLTHCFAVI